MIFYIRREVINLKKCELLSPAGNMEMLKYAIKGGSDAVYMAGNRFGARKYAENFTIEELKEAILYAHLYGVKVYITVNTLIYESEIDEFLEYIKNIHKLGVDAILIQDFGMLNLIRQKFPNLTIHASTQMHNNSKEEVELLKNLGVKRVVLDREMSMQDILTLPKNIEKEIFIHGSLCVSYSGQCLFSSFILNRSGNRGECAGLCRLPYKLEINGVTKDQPQHYLSLKDLCSINFIDKLIDLNIDSLKIEGRMKSPEYVGYITKIYRKIIDAYYNNQKYIPTKKEIKNMSLLFNRGITDGYLINFDNSSIANLISPNHIGIHLGTYCIQNDKIKIKLDDTLNQHDTIRLKEANLGGQINFLYNKKGELINSASKNEIVYIDNFLNATGKGEVRLVESSKLMEEIHNFEDKKVQIDCTITANLNKPLKIILNDGNNTLTLQGSIPSKSINRPITEQDIYRQINKTGSTIYNFSNIKINLEKNLFINLKDLNELRRNALKQLDELRKYASNTFIENEYTIHKTMPKRDFSLDVLVNTKEQYEAAKKFKCNIYTSNIKLYNSLKSENIFLKYPEKTSKFTEENYIISDYGALKCIKENQLVKTDYMLNVTNSYTVDSLLKYGIDTVCLSVEITDEEITNISKNIDPSKLEILIYGKIELMKMRYDIYPGTNNITLIDRNNSKYEIKKLNGLNYLMSNKPVDKTSKIDLYKRLGIKNYRIDFYKEEKTECENILSKIYTKIYEE